MSPTPHQTKPPSDSATTDSHSLTPISADPPSAARTQSIAGTLPPELLTIIFKHVEQLNGPDRSHQQLDRLRQCEVCRAWFGAQLQPNDYFVNSEAQATALIDALKFNPKQASRVDRIEIDGSSEHWPALLPLCTNVTEISLSNIGGLEYDCDDDEFFLSLPSSLTTLKLTLSSGGDDVRGWIPEFEVFPRGVSLQLDFLWIGEVTDGDYSSERVIMYLEDISPQITHLSLFCDPGEEWPEEEPGFLEPLLPGMRSLKKLAIDFYPIRRDNFVRCIVALDTLEELHIRNVGFRVEEFEFQIVEDVIEQAGEALRLLIVEPGPIKSDNDAAQEQIRHLEAVAAKREIKLGWILEGDGPGSVDMARFGPPKVAEVTPWGIICRQAQEAAALDRAHASV